MKPTRGSFSVWLPLLNLIMWVALLAVPATLTYLRLVQMAHGSETAKFSIGSVRANMPRGHFLPFALEAASFRNAQVLVSGNMPGFLIEILVSLPTTWPSTWSPSSMPFDTWRAITWPIYCLPAWWLVGLGLDTLLGWRRLHWGLLLTGTLLTILFAVLYFGFQVVMSPSERGEAVVAIWGFALWACLFAILPTSWFRQRRTCVEQKRAASQPDVKTSGV